MTRAIQIAIEAHEVVDFLTGRRALSLPEGVHVRNFFRKVETNPDLGVDRDVWYLSIEHESFPEVQFRIPRMSASEFARRYPVLPKMKLARSAAAFSTPTAGPSEPGSNSARRTLSAAGRAG